MVEYTSSMTLLWVPKISRSNDENGWINFSEHFFVALLSEFLIHPFKGIRRYSFHVVFSFIFFFRSLFYQFMTDVTSNRSFLMESSNDPHNPHFFLRLKNQRRNLGMISPSFMVTESVRVNVPYIFSNILYFSICLSLILYHRYMIHWEWKFCCENEYLEPTHEEVILWECWTFHSYGWYEWIKLNIKPTFMIAKSPLRIQDILFRNWTFILIDSYVCCSCIQWADGWY